MAAEEKKSKIVSIDDVLSCVKKKFSKDNPDIIFDSKKKFEAVSSGNLKYDLVSGVGGYPKSRISEIIAMESMGKTSMILSGIGAAQRTGMKSVLFDFEQSFDPKYAKRTFGIDVDMKTFLLFQPNNIEEGDFVLDALVQSKEYFDLIAFDSIECMKPKKFIEGSMEDTQMIGAHAKAISQFTHKLKNAAFMKGFAAVLTNQMKFAIQRDQYTPGIGLATGVTWKDQYTTPGGMTPRFLASIRMKLEYGGKEESTVKSRVSGENEEQKTSKLIKIVNLKNKCNTPELRETTTYDIPNDDYPGGWNMAKDILDIMRRRGIIEKEGQSYTFNGLKIKGFTHRGVEAFESAFINNPDVVNDALALFQKIRKEEGNTTNFVGRAVLGVDIHEGERKGQENTGEFPPESTVAL
ncbi:MAG: hypothetical protein WC511_01630 [Candidatus Pacearchaeota archaeon]